MADIFLSYARENHEQARMLAEILASFGWTVFWDREILAGAVFDDVIQEQLDHAKCVVCLWSVDSVISQWVRAEAEEGANRNMLVSVLIDDVRLPIAFRRIQAAKLLNWAGSKDDEQLKDVLRAVKFVVEKPPQVNQPGTGAPADPPVAKPQGSSSVKATPLPTSVPEPPVWKQTRYVAPFVAMLIMAAALAGYFWLKPHASAGPTKAEILAGDLFFVLFDELPYNIGTITPRGEYKVQFLPAKRQWWASGPVYQKDQGTAVVDSSPDSEPEKNGFSVWGASFRFDARAQVFFVAGGYDPGITERLHGQRVGRTQSLKTAISGGKPFVVAFDELSDHIGSIKPQGRYEIQFLLPDRKWQASGPLYPQGTHTEANFSFSGCEPEKSGLCVWDAPFRFDGSGRVFFVAGGNDPDIQKKLQGRQVGRIIL